ncbi:MAG: glycosyltransferase, partial [Planctomycetota bacterium]
FGRPQFASQSTTLLQPNTLPQPNASNFGGPVDTPNHAKSVLCVARLSREKGVDVLVAAFEKVVAARPQCRLQIAGSGPEREHLQQQIQTLGLDHHITLLGSVSDVAQRMWDADLFVLPSRSEGISLTLIEAMFAELPIIATAVGGTPEVIRSRHNGLLVPPGDPQTMADAIIQLVDDADQRKHFGEQGQACAAQRFSIDAMMNAYDSVYRRGSCG